MTIGLGSGGFNHGRNTAALSGTAEGRALFAQAMRKLAAVEGTDVYREMCAEAERRILAGGGRVADHGWGEYGANGDPRKRRKAAT